MVDAAKARLAKAVRLFLAATVAVLGAAGTTHAQIVSQEPAPIIYGKSPNTRVRLENAAPANVVGQPINVGPSSLSFDQFQGRNGALPPSASSTFDLRPGAAVAPVSFRATSRSPMSRAPGYAEPYAGPAYQVAGRWYVPMHEPNYDEVGVASWYGPNFHGKASATGETFDEMAMTAAHPTLPIPSLVRVTNLENGRTVIVRLNDRGPFVDDRIIDMSKGAATALGMIGKGTANVRVQYAGPAPLNPNADFQPVQVRAYEEEIPVMKVATLPAPVASAATPASPRFRAPAAAPTAEARGPERRGEGSPAPAKVREDADLHGFYLQAGAFADLGNAHRLRDRMQDFWPAFVAPMKTASGGELYRVMLGPWTDRVEAELARERLAQTGSKAILIARD